VGNGFALSFSIKACAFADPQKQGVFYHQKSTPWSPGSLFSFLSPFPKLDVAGLIPVSRSNLFNNLQTTDQKRAHFFSSFGNKAFSKPPIDSKLGGMNAGLNSRILLVPYLPPSGGTESRTRPGRTFL
jgi:hypothetical protein